MARATERLKQAMEVCELGALTLPNQVDVLMDAARAILQEAPTLTPPNEPLSIEQLREMDGEPVWVVPIGKCKWATRQWCVLAADEALIPGVEHWWWSFEGYGETWIAYCRPPEGEEDT